MDYTTRVGHIEEASKKLAEVLDSKYYNDFVRETRQMKSSATGEWGLFTHIVESTVNSFLEIGDSGDILGNLILQEGKPVYGKEEVSFEEQANNFPKTGHPLARVKAALDELTGAVKSKSSRDSILNSIC